MSDGLRPISTPSVGYASPKPSCRRSVEPRSIALLSALTASGLVILSISAGFTHWFVPSAHPVASELMNLIGSALFVGGVIILVGLLACPYYPDADSTGTDERE